MYRISKITLSNYSGATIELASFATQTKKQQKALTKLYATRREVDVVIREWAHTDPCDDQLIVTVEGCPQLGIVCITTNGLGNNKWLCSREWEEDMVDYYCTNPPKNGATNYAAYIGRP